VTPPHSAGIYYLFGFFLFGILFASSCSRRRPLPCRLPFAARPCLALVVLCVHVPVGLHVIGIRAAQAAPPSGTHAAGCDLAGYQAIVSALAEICFALACVWAMCCLDVHSLCVVLVCASVCASQSTFVLTYPKLHMYALL
jgi:hypothetical protein